MATIKKTTKATVGVSEDVEERDLCALLVGMQIGTAVMENSMKVPQKITNRPTM